MSDEDEEDRLQKTQNIKHIVFTRPQVPLLPTAPKGAISPTLRITTLQHSTP
ncbi:hypothetical protein T03_1220 [Trichinella britovi]|uniref:Uncharacterized protein n=1 Tax=Trichinella britovi TaxID=45882 RepID=A0A0V1C438_TRIBR|nr:hypothetical protein T03_1220 [Trichinella britovi]